MNISTEIIEADINKLLQQELSIVCKNKVLKEGKLTLFAVKDFYLNLKLFQQGSNKLIIFELPYPFSYRQIPTGLVLSYKIENFINSDAELKQLMFYYFYNKPSKFFDAEVYINKKQLNIR
jgi:hypothetical protein